MRAIWFAALMLSVSAFAAEELKPEDLIPKEFDRYRFVILRLGDTKLSETESHQTLLEHLAYLRQLNRAGDLLVYGPFQSTPADQLRGIAVFRGDLPLERVREMLDHDPFIKAGAMKYELHTWMTAKGQMQTRPASP